MLSITYIQWFILIRSKCWIYSGPKVFYCHKQIINIEWNLFIYTLLFCTAKIIMKSNSGCSRTIPICLLYIDYCFCIMNRRLSYGYRLEYLRKMSISHKLACGCYNSTCNYNDVSFKENSDITCVLCNIDVLIVAL